MLFAIIAMMNLRICIIHPMPWVIGIDEAGYGPNLGPLVQAAVAMHLPETDTAGWKTHREKVRRVDDENDGRRIVDDSKLVYCLKDGFALLEKGLQPFPRTVKTILANHGLADVLSEMECECWYVAEDCIGGDCDEMIAIGPRVVSTVTPKRFNRVVEEQGSKAVLIMRGFIALLQELCNRIDGDEPLLVIGDKHGGRHYYAAMVQEAFPDCWVMAERESPNESRYRVSHRQREVTVIFRPRADGDSISVALASMTAKYVRELCMKQFNAFWSKHVPDLKPTAGYPGDARRFFDEIKPAMKKLGIKKESVWRTK
jgi:ribonuclease HII